MNLNPLGHRHYPHTDPKVELEWARDRAERRRQPGCLPILMWALFIGWWASLIRTVVAWPFIVSGAGDRIGMRMLEGLPRVAFREDADEAFATSTLGIADSIEDHGSMQIHFGLRLAYTALIGCWLSGLALLLAWLMLLSIAGIPVARGLYRRVPRIATLAVYDPRVGP
jgi:uncharacterized membrane protein YccF (DUF307 family)